MHDRSFFLYMPKTAGMPLHHLTSDSLASTCHLDRFRGCGGRLSWAKAHQRGFMRGFNLTFLRDPMERVLSQYSFSKLAPGTRPDSVWARQLELRQLLLQTSGRFGSFWNAQTFLLSGLTGSEARPEKRLESALENLGKFHLVGLTEIFG